MELHPTTLGLVFSEEIKDHVRCNKEKGSEGFFLENKIILAGGGNTKKSDDKRSGEKSLIENSQQEAKK